MRKCFFRATSRFSLNRIGALGVNPCCQVHCGVVWTSGKAKTHRMRNCFFRATSRLSLNRIGALGVKSCCRVRCVVVWTSGKAKTHRCADVIWMCLHARLKQMWPGGRDKNTASLSIVSERSRLKSCVRVHCRVVSTSETGRDIGAHE